MTLQKINEKLKDTYGYSNKDNNFPRFRVVFSDDCLEQRVFKEKFYFEGKEVSEGTKVETVPKYPFTHGRHVFEVHYPTDNEEIVDKGGNYEPLYIFEAADGQPLPVEWDMIEYLCKALNTEPVKKSKKDLEAEHEKELDAMAKREFDMLDNKLPYLPSMLQSREAVFLDSKKVMK